MKPGKSEHEYHEYQLLATGPGADGISVQDSDNDLPVIVDSTSKAESTSSGMDGLCPIFAPRSKNSLVLWLRIHLAAPRMAQMPAISDATQLTSGQGPCLISRLRTEYGER